MSGKKKARVSYPGSEKVYIPGEINKIHVGMREIKLSDTVTTDSEGNISHKKNNPVIVYDTSGPYSDPKVATDFSDGIARIREEWCTRRKDIMQGKAFTVCPETDGLPGGRAFPQEYFPKRAKSGKNITQMYYAKRRIITPEMEYVAIRENQQIEALGLKSYITPDFVRKEVASGRAIIPANINHPEAEPMIIGKKFLIKVNMNIGRQSHQGTEEMLGECICGCQWGSDTLLDLSGGDDSHGKREWLLRNSPVPVGTVPIYQALRKAGGRVEDLSWDVFRDTLVEQAEQGVDIFTIHAAMLRKHTDLLLPRLTGIVSRGGEVIYRWMKAHRQENFLYTHFGEICEIVKAYDAIVSIGDGFRPGSVYDANDSAQMAELGVMGKLVDMAWDQYVQVMTEGLGHIPVNKIQANVKEQQYACHGAPYFSFGPLTTDIAPGYDPVASAIGAALTAWHGASLICCVMADDYLDRPLKEGIRDSLIAHKIAAHAADVAKGHPGAQVRDNALSKARDEGRWKDRASLSIDPERTLKHSKK